mgnify:FL=1
MENIENNQELHTEETKENMSDSFVKIEDWVYDYKSPDHKPPFQTDYCEMDVSHLDDEVIRLTVGKNGSNFTKITESNKIAWIYHNKETNKIEIWGKKDKLNRVKNQINNHIEWSKRYIENRNN